MTLIGPLTAEEWCSLRAGGPTPDGQDDVLQCCAITSEVRDWIFYTLRMGGDRAPGPLKDALEALVGHGLPTNVGDFTVDDRIAKLLRWCGLEVPARVD